MAKSKGGRPKVQHIVHTVRLDPDLQDFLISAVTAKIGVDGVSKPLAALLSHPAGLVSAGILAATVGIYLTPKDKLADLTADILMANPLVIPFIGLLNAEQKNAVRTGIAAALKEIGKALGF